MGRKYDKNGFINIEIKKIFEWKGDTGEGCFVSNKITKDGYKVGYMYRENPDDNFPDSGWRVLAGNEEVSYMDNPDNCHIFAINTVCNYDEDIIPYLDAEIGSDFVRVDNSKFEKDDGDKEIFICQQDVK